MVKKLYKHEFLAWLRVIVFFWAATIVTAIINRVVQLFENDSVYYVILFGFSLLAFFVGILISAAAPLIFGIVRFYKNFFTGEGYLTFTLPATKAQLLWVKISTAVCFSILSGVVCLLSGCIVMAGEVLMEVGKAAGYIFKDIPGDAAVHLIGWVLEILLIMLVAEFGTHMFYYTCICIGQTFRKNRILAAVGVYFAFYVITQILSSIFSIVLVVLTEIGALDAFGKFIETYQEGSIHIMLAVSLVLSAALGLLYWIICHSILKKKLNLE